MFNQSSQNTQLHNVDFVEFTGWKLYELDNECDLLVINSLHNSNLDRGCAQLSLSYLSKLKDIIPIAFFADDIANRLDSDQLNPIRNRCWLQEKTDPIPFSFIVHKVNSGCQFTIVDFRGNNFDLAEVSKTLGKFLFGELQAVCTKLFSRMLSINPDLQKNQFNFGLSSDQTIKLIGCPGHLVNSVYSDSFHQKFKEFWTSP